MASDGTHGLNTATRRNKNNLSKSGWSVWIGCRILADSGKELMLSTEVASTGTDLVEIRPGGRRTEGITEKRKLPLCRDGSP